MIKAISANKPLILVYKNLKKLLCFSLLVVIIWQIVNDSKQNVVFTHKSMTNNYDLTLSDTKNCKENITQIFRALTEVMNSRSEQWNYLSSLIAENANQNGSLLLDSDQLKTLADVNNVLDLDIENLAIKIKNLHKIQFKSLSYKIQKKIYEIQNPAHSDCNTTKMIYCYVHSCCGFGSQIDFIAKCLSYAYMTNTTAIIKDLIPNYLKHTTHKWDHYITPISETCQQNSTIHYNATQLPRVVDLNDLPNDEIGKLILDTHPNPKMFWYSQFARYAMRPNARIKTIIEESVIKCKFSHPIVGVQIRRGDKLIYEAKYHSNDEYMFHVRNYYDKLSLKGYNGNKNVFIATDDSSAIDDLRKRYSDYNFIDKNCFTINDKFVSRANIISDDNPNIDYIILDIHFLSMCDYIVCTMSSNVCRLSYELMMSTKSEDFTADYQSLDIPWFIWKEENQKIYRSFNYQHITTSTNGKKLTFNANDIVTESYYWMFLANNIHNTTGFVECVSETNQQIFQCPLYKTKQVVSLN